jgi:hypothetical protein
MSEEQPTPEEQQAAEQQGMNPNWFGTNPIPEEKANVHSFLIKVIDAEDTTKMGNLTEEELGNLATTLRATKELELISKEIMENDTFANYFKKEAEIITSTSLSKNAKLLNLAVSQKREIADVTPRRKPNSSWFKKKDKSQEEVQ